MYPYDLTARRDGFEAFRKNPKPTGHTIPISLRHDKIWQVKYAKKDECNII
ncbi:MAG: hypothetical protein KKD11_07140 [Candidatus Omnitrophica bacterium]|nr:hypothetical protein [Candidatus Omnitrophota bacterium]